MVSCRYVGQIHVALGSVAVPLKHRVDGFLKLCAALLVDTAGIYPEKLQIIILSLFTAEH
jgi:hypothetical protein